MRVGAVAIVFGTRPEAVKLAPLFWELGPTAYAIHTGQHPIETLTEILGDLGLDLPAVSGSITPTPRGQQIGEMVAAVTTALIAVTPDVVVVQGDTNSTLAGAIAATSLDLPLVHIEAGLRSFDRRMPEERNRIVVDHLADLACAPTAAARSHLLAEGIDSRRIVITGNTVVDAARRVHPSGPDRSALLHRLGLTSNEFILATFHRPENVDDPQTLSAVLAQLAALPLPVVLPEHPRTADQARRAGITLARPNVDVVPSLGFRDFLALEHECALIITDSGGLQEEATIVGRPALVVRRSTERPEALDAFTTLVAPSAISESAEDILSDLGSIHRHLASLPCPYGEGDAGKRSVAAIEGLLAGDS